jgi:DnaJ-domain-containing protein 1
MEMYMAMSYDELTAKINGMENAQKVKIQSFTDEFDTMKKEYDKMVAEKETAKLTSQTNMRLINEIKKTIETQKDEKEKTLRKMNQLEKIKKMAARAGVLKD